jgi:hypothetical protein
VKSFGTRYTPRYTRTAAASPAAFKGLPSIIRRGLIGSFLIVIFAFSVNQFVKTIVQRSWSNVHVPQLHLPKLSMFSTPKYLIDDGQVYVVYSDGQVKPADKTIDSKYMVRITGIAANEERPEFKAILKQALSIDQKYLNAASEINLRDPKNILMFTSAGQIVYFGNSIDMEKMGYFEMASDRLNQEGKKFRTMDLRYKDMAITK